jgi:hypothetical protein
MAAVQIPNPPPTPNGDAWVELYRGEDHIFYESADGEASVDLSLKSDGKRRFLEWGVVHWVVGLSRLKIREAWESGRPAEPPMSYHENGHEVVVHLPPSPGYGRSTASEDRRVFWYKTRTSWGSGPGGPDLCGFRPFTT